MAKKVRATGMIAVLFRQTEHFNVLLSHESLLQTLARIMREDMKKSIDLCINIVSVFFSISNFSQFHQLIMDNQVRPAHARHAMRTRMRRRELPTDAAPTRAACPPFPPCAHIPRWAR